MEISRLSRALRVALAFVSVLFVLALTAGPMAAQSDATPKWDLFAGYQWLNPGGTVPLSTSDPSNPNPFKLPSQDKGGGAALAYNFDRHWAEIHGPYRQRQLFLACIGRS